MILKLVTLIVVRIYITLNHEITFKNRQDGCYKLPIKILCVSDAVLKLNFLPNLMDGLSEKVYQIFS